jgi:hypothetical protein
MKTIPNYRLAMSFPLDFLNPPIKLWDAVSTN